MASKHPYPPFIPENATKLIIGTIPPPRFCSPNPKLLEGDLNFYYGSRDNSLWEIIGKACGNELRVDSTEKSISNIKQHLTKNGIGITDVVESCVHKNNEASDNKLENIVHKDLRKLLKDNPNVTTLLYTSTFVKKQVNDIFKTYHSIDKTDNRKQQLKIDGKTYDVVVLYSPSPNALRGLGENGSNRRVEQYKNVFG